MGELGKGETSKIDGSGLKEGVMGVMWGKGGDVGGRG